VPDVDAIPFAKRILRDDSFVSPIPAGARRAGLYEKIKAGALRMRKYRTLREAAAAAFVAASAQIAPGYEALIPRFHLVLGLNGNDPERVARVLEGIGSREELLRLLDDLILKGPDEQKQAAYRKRERAHRQHASARGQGTPAGSARPRRSRAKLASHRKRRCDLTKSR
jgi:hypothetical protein